jgi:uncharacterized protein (TIGR03437 family)
MNNPTCLLAILSVALSAVCATGLTFHRITTATTAQTGAFSVSGVIRGSTGSDPAAGVCDAQASAKVTLTFTRVAGSGALPAPINPIEGPAPLGWKAAGFETGTTYRVTPNLDGFVFTPASRDFSGEKSDLDFTIYKGPFKAAGRVADADGNAMESVRMDFSLEPLTPSPPTQAGPPSVQTAGDGGWQQNFPCNSRCGVSHRYAARPAKQGMFFTPASIQFCGASNDLNFVGRPLGATGVSAASYRGQALANDSIVALYGAGFSTATEVTGTQPLPTQLAGASVKTKDRLGAERLASLFFVSPNQINFLVPADTARGDALLIVTNAQGRLFFGPATIATYAPGLFAANADGQGVAAAIVQRVKADGTLSFEVVARFDPAQNKLVAVPIDLGAESDQVFLILFGTGIRNRDSIAATAAKIGGTDVQVLFAGAQPGFAGLDQVNVRLARSLAGRGEMDVALTIDGSMANLVRISVK